LSDKCYTPGSKVPFICAFSSLSYVAFRDSEPLLGGLDGLCFSLLGGESGDGPFIMSSSASTASSE